MKLTSSNFCQYVKDESTNLKTVYTCKRTGEICPKVDYRTGKPLPSNSFIKNGCQINKQIVEEVKKEAPKKVKKVDEVKKEPIKEVAEKKEEVAKKAPAKKPVQRKRTNTSKKKSNSSKK